MEITEKARKSAPDGPPGVEDVKFFGSNSNRLRLKYGSVLRL
jgi:hypothetical protein